MGVCSSCLGRERDHELSDEDEQSRLLFDDPHANHYGSFGENNTGAILADPQEVQRENEALQKIVTLTSNHLVDIFAMVPQNAIAQATSPTATNTLFPAQDARLVRYQDVLSKISPSDPSCKTNQHPIDHTPIASDGWISDDEDVEEMKGHTPVKSEGIGALLGGFADADSAMR
ncbi:late endosomal/lysosomal adaptor and MAPK and MTOR activator-domain-containing protein [Rhexocercosporidium sp. MPI-PUGE-AT-0058]|nr:late endosomal/lysosomal adaptor and MAPK and MTOR activator-domain-containing protein [Rhexocercosporidium sp. MPI-PUGE-AT-0058]